eukprot:gb/GEZN01006740.1/.p1 GENE.gb/GEZN01006740.1/~~gb/GEZN01006740.1/.p1  ORF type:complete len:464 (+),score=69.94 gb/GEZN01006740.1/:67-1458(+)
MQVHVPVKRESSEAKPDHSRKRQTLLSFYRTPPQQEISLHQFEAVAIARLSVLRQAELLECSKMHKNQGELLKDILEATKKFELTDPQVDQISHFILRLAFCRSPELRQWFMKYELLLFRARFEHSVFDVDGFFEENDLKYRPITSQEYEGNRTLYDNLAAMSRDEKFGPYYKVPFEEATQLVRFRNVYLSNGDAYVSRKHLGSLVAGKFRTYLSRQLAITNRSTAALRRDERVGPMLATLSRLSPSYKTTFTGGTVTRDQLPMLSDQSFPLCMHVLYKGLKKDNHLKHGGRMQLGLFLKAIGLSLDDSLAFWRSSFSPKTPPDKFDKQYAYNVRHNYGKEGRRTSYTPYGCAKIIQSTPGPSDHHGCPFRHFDAQSLKNKLGERRVPNHMSKEIIQLVQGQHYQLACRKYFEVTHPGSHEDVGNHPNQYFDASLKYWQEKADEQAANKNEKQTVDSSSSAAP